MNDLVVDQGACDGEGSSNCVFLFPRDIGAMLHRQISEEIISTISRAWHFTTKSGGIWKFLTKYLDWASVREDTITAYTQEFTEPELKKWTEFYKTPVGKKANEKMPQLVFIAGQIGLKKAQVNQAELQQMMEERTKQP
jgi:hypothetical protein